MVSTSSFKAVIRRLHELVGNVANEKVQSEIASEVLKLNDRVCNMSFPKEHFSLNIDVFCGSMYTSKEFVCDLFLIPKVGKGLQLHDHPGITGFLRPIAGKMVVTSFSWMDEEDAGQPDQPSPSEATLIPARYEGKTIIDSASPTVISFDSIKGQYHAVEALSPVSAFVDVLMPGYEEANAECTYYICDDPNPQIGEIYWLRVVSQRFSMTTVAVAPSNN